MSSHRTLIALLLFCGFATPLWTTANQASADSPQQFALPESDDGLPGAGPIRRYDWFRNLWSNRRSDFAKQVQAQQNAVVFLGDSITQGWGDDFQGRFPEMKLANRGISGDTTRGMLIRLKEDVLDLHPAAVVMLMGTNDLEEAAEPETIAANISLILAELKKHNEEMPIVLCQVFPSSSEKKRPAEKIKQINSLVASVVKGDSQIILLDTWTLFANKDGDADAAQFPDLLHPNESGYQMWAGALRPVFATLGFLETEPDDFRPEPGFTSLFNGKDLTGWGYRKTTEPMLKARENWRKNDPNAAAWPVVKEPVSFDGQRETPEHRYVAINGRLVVTTPPEGRKIQQLWTTREFGGDFTLKLEFRATPNADSGVFIRDPQLQCRDFPLAGPYKDLKKYKSGDWNELVAEVKNGVARCTCNGELLEAEFKVPESGPIGLEGDRGQMEYRRIRIRQE
ncbi:MAG: GDSL-type esterase/lipase family protein [Planctomycetaceae bacterium]